MNTTLAAPICPKCKVEIRGEDINVATDIAYCRRCNIPLTLSSLVRSADLEKGLDLQRPPEGTWYQSSPLETVIGASHRSLGASLGLFAISLFWNGIVSVFVAFAISGTLAQLGVRAPKPFPAPIMNGGPVSLGMTLFLWVFLTPFILIGSAMIAAFLSTLAGRTEIRLREPEGVIFSGIGRFGLRKRFQFHDVKDVRVLNQSWRDSDGDMRRRTNVVLETMAGKEIKFGSMLTEERRRFVAGALRKSLPVANFLRT